MWRFVLVAVLVGCGAKPDLAGDGGLLDANPVSMLSIDPISAMIATGDKATFTISNAGPDTSDAIALEVAGMDSGSFLIASPSCTTLPANASCTVDVFGLGRVRNASAVLKAMAGDTSAMADLKGDGTITGSGLLVTTTIPGAMFTPTALGSVSGPVSYTVTNGTNGPSGTIVMSLDTSNPQFKTHNDTCTGKNLLATGNTCTIEIIFAPSGSNPTMTTRSGLLTATGSPSSIAGTAMLTAQLGKTVLISPSGSHDFGAVSLCPLTPASTVYSLSNPTSLPWAGFTAVTNGNDMDSFVVSTTCTPTQAAGSNCTVTATVSGKTVGPKSTLLVISVMQNGNTFTFQLPLSANMQACDITASPTAIMFDPTLASTTSPPHVVTVTNNSTTTSHLLTATIVGAQAAAFTLTADGCTGMSIPPTLGCTFAVTFRAPAGTYNATVNITTPGLGPVPVTLNGMSISGPMSQVSFMPPGLNFPTTATGQTSQSMPLTVKTTGTTGVLTVSTTGPFSQTNNCTTLVDSSSTCTVNVTFAPNTTGAVLGSVMISGTPGGSATAQLTGSGG